MFLLDVIGPGGGNRFFYLFRDLLPTLVFVAVLVVIMVGILIFKNAAPQKWEKLKSFFRKK